MSTNTPDWLSPQDVADVRRMYRGRSVREGLKVVAILGLTLAAAGGLAMAAAPATAWTMGLVAGLGWLAGASRIAAKKRKRRKNT